MEITGGGSNSRLILIRSVGFSKSHRETVVIIIFKDVQLVAWWPCIKPTKSSALSRQRTESTKVIRR